MPLMTSAEIDSKLRDHFCNFYKLFSEGKLVPEAMYGRSDNVLRCLSGVPAPTYNAVIDSSQWKGSPDECIAQQIHFFDKAAVPFVWYVDEDSNIKLERALERHGFICPGVFQGVVSVFDKPMPNVEIPKGYVFEQVNALNELEEFNVLLCDTFGIFDPAKKMNYKLLEHDFRKKKPLISYWVAKKEGKIVSGLSTVVFDDAVSMWNAATKLELRRQGLFTMLLHMALQDAIRKGCRLGISYMMSEALALGVCSKFGYETKWRFNPYFSPSSIM